MYQNSMLYTIYANALLYLFICMCILYPTTRVLLYCVGRLQTHHPPISVSQVLEFQAAPPQQTLGNSLEWMLLVLNTSQRSLLYFYLSVWFNEDSNYLCILLFLIELTREPSSKYRSHPMAGKIHTGRHSSESQYLPEWWCSELGPQATSSSLIGNWLKKKVSS